MIKITLSPPQKSLREMDKEVEEFSHEGASRAVILDGETALKKAKIDSGLYSNWKEAVLWKDVIEDTELEEFFVPVVEWAEDYSWLKMEEAELSLNVQSSELDELKSSLNSRGWKCSDLGLDNVGYHDDKLKVLDYGFQGSTLEMVLEETEDGLLYTEIESFVKFI